MYCAKVVPGTEWVRVKHFSDGFLPTYKMVDAEGKSRGKAFVVPGYVFMLREALRQRCLPVPDEEWKVIEATSDPHTTYVDAGTGKILQGPLKVVEKQITFRTVNSVQVCADLLGRRRQYWLPVRTVMQEELAAEEAKKSMKAVDQMAEKVVGHVAEKAAEETAEIVAAAKVTSDTAKKDAPQNEKEPKRMSEASKNGITEEQKAAMLARAEEIGVKNAATEFGVPWQMIAQHKRRVKAQVERESNSAAPPNNGVKVESVLADPGSASDISAVGKAKPAGPSNAKKEKATAKAKSEAIPAKKADSLAPADIEALKVANAVLQDQIRHLEDRVIKLTKAVREMIS